MISTFLFLNSSSFQNLCSGILFPVSSAYYHTPLCCITLNAQKFTQAALAMFWSRTQIVIVQTLGLILSKTLPVTVSEISITYLRLLPSLNYILYLKISNIYAGRKKWMNFNDITSCAQGYHEIRRSNQNS